MPSRRLLLVLAVVGAAVALAVGTWLLRPQPSLITADNAARIREGMTLDEVEAILGGPARHDATGRVSYCLEGIPGVRPISPAMREWTSDEVLVMVWIGEDGRVQRRLAVPVRRDRIDEIVRRWLGL
jgi:hypothetical protein